MKDHSQPVLIHKTTTGNALDLLFIELITHLLEPTIKKSWLQKTVNLLKQYLKAEHVTLHTFIDNLIVGTSHNLSVLNFKNILEPYWSGNCYIVPLSIEGNLQIVWGEKPSNDTLKDYNYVFLLLNASLKNRSKLICQAQDDFRLESLFRLEKILDESLDLKNQIKAITCEVSKTLNATRCQIKIFSQNADSTYDSLVSSESVNGNFVDALSVIPRFEEDWLNEIKQGIIRELNEVFSNKTINDPTNIDALLSIKSIFAYPLVYKGKAIGVLILHQCDYERVWKKEELSYIKQICLLLNILFGNELEIKEKYHEAITDQNTGLINSDELLRELNHIQIEAKIANSFFSLIMIDIERLKDINLELGFVAGNLVLSQTARYLKRLYGGIYDIARYSNDEFVIVLRGVDQNGARLEAEKLKEYLSNISVLGVGTVDYNFSFVTFPTHATSISSLLTILEQAMILSKSRGKSQVSGFDEVQGAPKDRWQQLLSSAIPEIILKKSNLKTGPEIIKNINQYLEKQKYTYNADVLDSIQSLALALDAKDSYTEGHSKRVSEYAYILAKSLGLDLQEVEWIRLAAVMHDIGKIGIPESILCKPAKLTKEEYEIMKKHPVIGARILKPIKPLEKVANLVLYHHEYWDGSGYPNGLSKNDIPIGARIVSIVDAYQAMTSNRPYRATLPFEEAIKRLKDGKEKQWDPELVERFISIII